MCGTEIDRGKVRCRGCRADVVYGKTQDELNAEMLVTFKVGGFLTYIILVGIPKLINSIFNWNIAPRFGLSLFSLLWLWIIITLLCLKFFFLIRFKDSKERKKRIRCCYYNVFDKSYVCKDVEE